MRIPTCKHFFHPICLKKWFESKAQEDEQRCPQCNSVLKTEAMRRAKAENQQLNYTSPVKMHNKIGVDASVELTEQHLYSSGTHQFNMFDFTQPVDG